MAAHGDTAAPLGVDLAVLLRLRDKALELQASQGPLRVWRSGWEDPPTRRQAGEALTTECVCFEIIRVETATTMGPFIDLVPKEDVRPAGVFVSHAWRYVFCDLVAAIEAAPLGPRPSFWVDVILNSQWQTATRPFSWWTTTFKQSIVQIGRTLAVFAPFDDPVVLTRAWCLYELFCASSSGGELTIVMPPPEEARFLRTLSERFDSISVSLSRLSLARAEAFSPHDRAAIFAAVEAGVGLHALDTRVLAASRAWLVTAGLAAYGKAVERERAFLGARLGPLLVEMGRLEEAEPLYSHALAFWAAEPSAAGKGGAEGAEMLSCALNWGTLLYSTRRFEEAEGHFRHAVAGFGALLAATLADGKDEEKDRDRGDKLTRDKDKDEDKDKDIVDRLTSDLVKAQSNLGALCASTGRLEEARAIYASALALSEARLGADAPGTLLLVGNSASLLSDLGDLPGAVPLLRRAMAGRGRTLGESHPSTLFAVHNLAVLLRALGQLEEAEPLAERALLGREKVLGTSHPETLASVQARAWFHAQRGETAQAEPLLKRAHEGFQGALGREAALTTSSAEAYGALCLQAGQLDKAAALYAEALAGREARGVPALQSLPLMSSLARLEEQRLQLPAAESLYATMLAALVLARGEADEQTLTLRHMLARVVVAQGASRAQDAERLLRDALQRRRAVLGPGHAHALLSGLALGAFLAQRPGCEAEAVPLLEAFVRATEGVLPDEDDGRLRAFGGLASAALARGEHAAAAELLRTELRARTRAEGGDSASAVACAQRLQACLLAAEKGGAVSAAAAEGHREAPVAPSENGPLRPALGSVDRPDEVERRERASGAAASEPAVTEKAASEGAAGPCCEIS